MLKKWIGALYAIAFAGAAEAVAPPAERFVDPMSVRSAMLSPNGAYVAYLGRTDADQRIVVVDIAARRATVITTMLDESGYLDWVQWKGNDRLIFSVTSYVREGGRAPTGRRIRSSDAQWRVPRIAAVNRDGSNVVQMFQGQLSTLVGGYGPTFLLSALPNEPGHVLIGAWEVSGFGAWRADVATGRVERIVNGTVDTRNYAVDGTGAPVLRLDRSPDGSAYRTYRRAPNSPDWVFVQEVRATENTQSQWEDFNPVAAGPGAGQVYILARPNNADLSSLYLYNSATGDYGAPIQQAVGADAVQPWVDERTHEVLATCTFAARLDCRAREPAMQRHLTAISSFFSNQATIRLVNMSDDRNKWLLQIEGPTEAGGYYLYDVAARQVIPVASIYPSLDTNALSPTQIVTYRSRDGAELWAYVTARAGVAGPRPTVIFPHGGPEARDYFGFSNFAQFLASRGYVVVQPNFRGGSGFGRAFADAGRGQWGRRMQDDVTDAVQHMITAGVADRQRICIVGASYGGNAALAGVSLTPELYKCGVSIAGVSDLRDVLRTQSSDGRTTLHYQYWLRSIGDPRTSGETIAAVSPHQQAARVTAPVLLIHGEGDTVVPIRQSQLMHDALSDARRSVRLVRIPEEGHYWDAWSREHRLTMFRETETFLAQHLGFAAR